MERNVLLNGMSDEIQMNFFFKFRVQVKIKIKRVRGILDKKSLVFLVSRLMKYIGG